MIELMDEKAIVSLLSIDIVKQVQCSNDNVMISRFVCSDEVILVDHFVVRFLGVGIT